MRTGQFLLVVLAMLMGPAGGGDAMAQTVAELPANREEVTVQAGDFTIVGDLYLPLEGARHPLIVWVHGSGPITRQLMIPLLRPQIELLLKAGFAFFIDDIPGSGASKGQMTSVYRDRALILIREVETLRERPDIIPDRIGVAGASQAGIVIPLAASQTPAISFVIAEACVAECSYRQDAYLVEQYMKCQGIPPDIAADVARAVRTRYETESWEEYLLAVEKVNADESCKLIGLNNPPLAEDQFRARTRSPERLGSYFDPMPLVADMTIPVLALFGGKDRNINSEQGVNAYRKALAARHNDLSRVELVAGANHMMYTAETGCVRELMAQVDAGVPHYDPEALSIIESWLKRLKDSWTD